MREQSTGRGNPSELSVEGNVRGEKRLLFLVKTESQGLDLPSCWKQTNMVHSVWSNSLKTLGVRHGGKLPMRDGKQKGWLPGCLAHCLEIKTLDLVPGKGTQAGQGCLPALTEETEQGVWESQGHELLDSPLRLSYFNLDFSHFKEKIPIAPSYMSFSCPFSYPWVLFEVSGTASLAVKCPLWCSLKSISGKNDSL